MSHQHLNSMPKRFCYFYQQAPQLLIDLLHADLMKISQHLLSNDGERAGAKHSAVLRISGVASVWKQGKFIFPVPREDLVIVFLCCRQGRNKGSGFAFQCGCCSARVRWWHAVVLQKPIVSNSLTWQSKWISFMTEARTSPYVLYASNFKQVNAILIFNNHIHLIFLSEWFVECAYRPIHKMLLITIQNWNPA